jgi:hypothetical protein
MIRSPPRAHFQHAEIMDAPFARRCSPPKPVIQQQMFQPVEPVFAVTQQHPPVQHQQDDEGPPDMFAKMTKRESIAPKPPTTLLPENDIFGQVVRRPSHDSGRQASPLPSDATYNEQPLAPHSPVFEQTPRRTSVRTPTSPHIEQMPSTSATVEPQFIQPSQQLQVQAMSPQLPPAKVNWHKIYELVCLKHLGHKVSA